MAVSDSEANQLIDRFEKAVAKLERQRQRTSLSESLRQTGDDREYDAAKRALKNALKR